TSQISQPIFGYYRIDLEPPPPSLNEDQLFHRMGDGHHLITFTNTFIRKWLDENCADEFDIMYAENRVYFVDQEDAVAFKLWRSK
uniref:hypothetical protein n=1 Tax=Methylobacterium sp. B34 TaxID=95563 RepID=UPI0019553BBA